MGTTVNLDGAAYEIVGVAPEGFFFGPQNTALWTPLDLERGAAPRDQRILFVAGRLADGVSARRVPCGSIQRWHCATSRSRGATGLSRPATVIIQE